MLFPKLYLVVSLLISNVCDNNFLVDQSNGYLFDPDNIDDIAEKIILFCKLENEKKKKFMSISSRKKAEILFNKKKYIDSHLNIIKLIND